MGPSAMDSAATISSFALSAFPNPFNTTTTIRFDLAQSGKATLDVFDLLGRHVDTLVSGQLGAGEHQASWDGSRYSSGLYFVRLETAQGVRVQKIALLK